MGKINKQNLESAHLPEGKRTSLSDDPEMWLSLYGDYLFNYALLQLKNKSEAEDVLQDAFLSAYKARDQFEGRSSVKTWLVTILRNKIIDHIRKKKRESLSSVELLEGDLSLNSSFNSFGIWSKWLDSWGGSPEKLCEQQGFMKQVSLCLTSLPSNLRQVFILRNVDNLSTEEICSELNISHNNVWVILYRARMKLRECIETNWYGAK